MVAKILGTQRNIAIKLRPIHVNRDGGAVSTWGGGLVLNVTRSNRRSSTYRLSSGVARTESLGGQNRVVSGRAQEVKQGVASGSKLQDGGGTRGRGYRLPVRQC